MGRLLTQFQAFLLLASVGLYILRIDAHTQYIYVGCLLSIIYFMTYWGFSKPQPYVEEEEGCRRPVSRYGHPYDYGAKDGADGTEAWGACLGVLICIMLLLLLAF